MQLIKTLSTLKIIMRRIVYSIFTNKIDEHPSADNFKKDQFIFANHHVRLITIQDLLNDPNSLNLRNHRIVYSGIEDIKQDLKDHFRISLLKTDWTKNLKEFELINQKFIKVYDSLKKKFFMGDF